MNYKTILQTAWRVLAFYAVILSLVVVVLSYNRIFRPTNCGGNSAALSQIKSLGDFVMVTSMDRPDHTFNLTKLSDDELRELAPLASCRWIRSARFFVQAGEIKLSSPERRILAFCDTSFRNVPERVIGLSPPTHAVVYTDGTAGLISVTEYDSLDHSQFVDLASIVGSKASKE